MTMCTLGSSGPSFLFFLASAEQGTAVITKTSATHVAKIFFTFMSVNLRGLASRPWGGFTVLQRSFAGHMYDAAT